MFARRMSLVLASLAFCVSAACAQQLQSLPVNRVITYSIYETPGDETTPLTWTIQVWISALHRDGNTVDWRISKVKITDVAQNHSWTDNIPIGESCWMITHENPLNPMAGEFGNLPSLAREAAAQGTGDRNLQYEIQGSEATATAIWVPHFWWKFQHLQASSPAAEGKDKSVFASLTVDAT